MLIVNSCVQTIQNKIYIDFHDKVKMNDGSDVKKKKKQECDEV